MTRKHLIIGSVAAAAVSVALAFALLTPTKEESRPRQMAQAGENPQPSGIYCYNGLKADTVDKWAPLYRGWVCVPSRVN
jgi:hypothetical protein